MLTPAQYGMCYRQAKPDEKHRNLDRIGEFSNDQLIVVNSEQAVVRRPLLKAHWAEGRLMILRSKPVVIYAEPLEYKGLTGEEEEHGSLYGNLILYRPWNGRDEKTEFGSLTHDLPACRLRHEREKAALDEVKEGLNELLLGHM